jgi:hypothetical protein
MLPAVVRRAAQGYALSCRLANGEGVTPSLARTQHVGAASVDLVGHFEDLFQLVSDRRFAASTGQNVVTGAEGDVVCRHNDYFYSRVSGRRKWTNHTITRPERANIIPLSDSPLGYHPCKIAR